MLQNVFHNNKGNGIMKLRYVQSFFKIFETDKNGDFKDDRIVFFVFGSAILLTGFVEGIAV
jgi:hypothetical protein